MREVKIKKRQITLPDGDKAIVEVEHHEDKRVYKIRHYIGNINVGTEMIIKPPKTRRQEITLPNWM